jgi:TetR/AcrR family transcriptional repressor of nem operon
MGHSRAEKAESRERIISAAARQIREGGLERVSIADLMKEANLTHGGFYGHFASRAELIAAALERALDEGEAASATAAKTREPRSLKAILNGYLSPAHRDNAGGGCAISALAGDIGRAEPDVRAIMTKRLENYFAGMRETLGDGPEADDRAVAAWCTMVGAVLLSRVFKGDQRSDAILRQARQAILRLEGGFSSTASG